MHARAVLILALAACGPLPGDRAGGGGGTGGSGCPATEDCSPETPNGLFFEGRSLGNEVFGSRGDHPTAVGGAQTYRLYINADRVPLQASFVPEIDEADAGVAEITGTAGNTVTVRALEPGFYSLRILDLDGALMDRITLETAALEAVELDPTFADILADPDGTVDPENPPLYLEGGEVDLVVRLEDGNTNAVVDEALAVEGLSAGDNWDLFPAVPIGPEPLAITAASGSHQAGLAITSTIDAVIPTNTEITSPIEMGANSTTSLCFGARRGSQAVLGAAWSFAITADAVTLAEGFSRSCIQLQSGAPETASFTAAAEQVLATFDVVVSAALAPVDGDGLPEHRALRAPMAGDRAAR